MRIRGRLYSWLIVVSLGCVGEAHAEMPVIDFAVAAQLAQQLSELERHADYLKQQISVLSPGQYQWSNAQNLINELGTVMNQTTSLAYSSDDLESRFKSAFPGYKAPQDFNAQYRNNMTQSQNTLNGVLQSMGTNARDFQNENKRLAFLQNQAQNAQGQTQAIQASSQLASETVSQIQLLRQNVMAQTNAEVSYYATQLQNEASSEAELNQIISAGSTSLPGYGNSGDSLEIPDF